MKSVRTKSQEIDLLLSWPQNVRSVLSSLSVRVCGHTIIFKNSKVFCNKISGVRILRIPLPLCCLGKTLPLDCIRVDCWQSLNTKFVVLYYTNDLFFMSFCYNRWVTKKTDKIKFLYFLQILEFLQNLFIRSGQKTCKKFILQKHFRISEFLANSQQFMKRSIQASRCWMTFATRTLKS